MFGELRPRRALLLLAAALLTWIAPRSALAWVETHVIRDDVSIDVSPDGSGRVEHRLVLKVAGGPLQTFDLEGVDADAVPEQGAFLVPERAAQKKSLEGAEPVTLEVVVPKPRGGASAEPVTPSLRLRFAGRGLGRGSYVVTARYRTDLQARGALSLDGALGTLAWRGAVLPDGLDAARLVVTLPAGSTPPSSLAEKSEGEGAPVVLSTVTRVGQSDRIELVRPYAPKQEAVTWRMRFDSRALGAGGTPAVVPEASPRELGRRLVAAPSVALPTAVFVGGVLAFVALAFLALAKAVDARRTAKARHAVARPLVPMPAPARALAFATLLLAGVVLVGVHGRVVAGSVCLLVASLVTWFRPAKASRPPLRGAGKWLVVAEREATARPPLSLGSPVDASTPAGLALLALVLAAVGVGLTRLREQAPYHTLLLGLGATALLPLFLTGRRDQLPPDPILGGRKLLRAVAERAMRRLRPHGARLIGRLHVPTLRGDPDELRLALVPRVRPVGLTAIEFAVGFAEVGGGWVQVPEIVVRARTGSPTDTLLHQRFDGVAHDRGERREGERVVTFAPRIPTAVAAADLWVAVFVALSCSAGERPSAEAAPGGTRSLATPPSKVGGERQAAKEGIWGISSEPSQVVGST